MAFDSALPATRARRSMRGCCSIWNSSDRRTAEQAWTMVARVLLNLDEFVTRE